MRLRERQLIIAAAALMIGHSPRVWPDEASAPASGPWLFREDFEQGLSDSWKAVRFFGTTEYKVVREGTNAVLQAHASQTASGLAREQLIKFTPGLTLHWRWKIDKIPAGGSDTRIEAFDHSARLFVVFKSAFGPPRTINYVWANSIRAGQSFEHPRSGRARFIALESGEAKAGKWIAETRDLMADWKRLFKGEPPTSISGIGLMTDADGTKDSVTGWYDDLLLEKEPK